MKCREGGGGETVDPENILAGNHPHDAAQHQVVGQLARRRAAIQMAGLVMEPVADQLAYLQQRRLCSRARGESA